MKKLLLIDGNAIMHRAFHAIPTLTSADGTPTNMIYGFFLMLHGAITGYAPNYLAVCFDTPKPTFRTELIPAYQAQRPSVPDEFKLQIPIIQSLLDTAQIPRFQKDGYEADDVIGTISRMGETAKLHTYILTGDKDIFQLVTENTSVLSPKTGASSITEFTPKKVQEKMGISPSQIPDYKALAGDPSDNYKGVPGIGPKTASGLITRFGSIEGMYKDIDNVENERVRTKLQENEELVRTTKKVATIVRNVELECAIKDMNFYTFSQKLSDSFDSLQLRALRRRYFPNKPEPIEKKPELKKTKPSQPTLF